VRRVRSDTKDPLTAFLKDAGVPWENDQLNSENVVFSFPTKAPSKSVCVNDVGAVDQLETWQLYNDYYTEHKPSVTIYYGEDEFLNVCNYVWDNFNTMSGIAFLPKSGHTYQQAPYEEISKETYLSLSEAMPTKLDWDKLVDYENEDNTSVQPELACSANGCEL